jgi:hypothetical protein
MASTPATSSSSISAFLGANQKDFLADGAPIRLRGFGLGNWLNIEHFMIGLPGTESQMRRVLADVYGADKAEWFWNAYYDAYFTDADAALLESLGVNCIRVPVNHRHFEADLRPHEFDDSAFAQLDRVIELCGRRGIYIVLDMHTAPGGQNPDWHCDNEIGEALFWQHPEFQQRLINLWRFIARHYWNNKFVAGYDLLNEPVCPDAQAGQLAAFHTALVAKVREVDPNHLLFIEGNHYGHDFRMYKPLEDPQIAYSFHDYPFFDLSSYLSHDRRDRLAQRVRNTSTLDYVRDVLKRPIWCGETGIPCNKGQLAEHEQVNDEFISVLEAQGISWSLWCYKDARSMGAVRPVEDSPWMSFSRRAAEGWRFWEDFNDNAPIDALEKRFAARLDPSIRRKLKFRQLADHQYVLTETFRALLKTIPFDELVTYPKSFLLGGCDRWEAILNTVRRLTGRRA